MHKCDVAMTQYWFSFVEDMEVAHRQLAIEDWRYEDFESLLNV